MSYPNRGHTMDIRTWLNQFEKIVIRAMETTADARREMLTKALVVIPLQFLQNKEDKRAASIYIVNYATPVLFEITNINKNINKSSILDGIMFFGQMIADAIDVTLQMREIARKRKEMGDSRFRDSDLDFDEPFDGIFQAFQMCIYRAFHKLGLKQMGTSAGTDLMKEFGFDSSTTIAGSVPEVITIPAGTQETI